MSENGVTLSDVLAAVLGLGTQLAELNSRVNAQGAKIDAQGAKHDELRVVLMDRMDRLQDSLSSQKDDMDVLLGLIAGTQRVGERAQSEARASFDLNSQMISTVAALERRVRRLQDDVSELRGKA